MLSDRRVARLRNRGVTRSPALATLCLYHVAAVGETALGMAVRLRMRNGGAIHPAVRTVTGDPGWEILRR